MEDNLERIRVLLEGHSAHEKILDEVLSAISVDMSTQKILGASKLAHEMFAYEMPSLVGRHINDLIPDVVREKHDDYVKRYALEPVIKQMADRRIECVNQNGITFKCNVWLLPSEANPSNVLVVFFK